MKVIKIFIFLLGLVLFIKCATNPLTGRKSLSFVSNDQIFPSSFQQYKDVLSSSKIITNTQQAKEVSEVGNRIKIAAENYYKSIGKQSVLDGYQWQFTLIDDPKTINAWCMPGGKVAVYTGIMNVCKNETGLAVVLGHEIAHALAGHGSEKISQTCVAELGGQLLGGVTDNQVLRKVINDYYPIASDITLLRYGRKQETDADTMGLYLMAMAGYDPREAPIFWERMIRKTGNSTTPEFLSTHPDPENRIAKLNQIMPKALEYYNNALIHGSNNILIPKNNQDLEPSFDKKNDKRKEASKGYIYN